MSSRPPQSGGPSPTPSKGPDRQGSVKRARQLLEAGVRPTPVPAPMPRPPPPSGRPSPAARNLAHQTQWPLPDSGLPPRPLQPQPLNPQHPRYLMPRGPPPFRPPRPSEVPSQVPSPSIYSVRSGVDSETNSVYPMLHARSFSHPKPLFVQHPQHARSFTHDGPVSPTSTVDLTPRISIATDELFHRQSTASGSSSAPDVPPIPLPEPPYPHDSSRQRAAGLAPPPSVRKSAVSPIPEEFPNPRQTLGSLASSRVIPSSWGSGPPESEILGAYLDNESEDEDSHHTHQEADVTLVRNASLGKRGKPTMRTIMKSNPNSEIDPIPDVPSSNPKDEYQRQHAAAETAGGLAIGTAISQVLHAPSTGRRTSVSTGSDESCVDPEKPRFAQQHDHPVYNSALEKELEVLPKAAPTMSDKRPGGKKPPRLDMNAVRDAEARGSLSSLSDLIRRATKLASNLDRGKTASRCDMLGQDADLKAALGEPGRRRGSGSISDILTSFPRPGFQTPEGRSSWPVFFGRSGLRNVEPLHSNDEDPNAKRPARKCCGMPRKWFVLLCILLFIIVVLAILLPVFLVAIPKQNHSNTNSCATTNPCQNGGVSVSSGSECSCVCSNGYTGSQCTVSGDSSCVTSEVENGTISKNATMGSGLPNVFSASSSKFNITLDSVTIMALFSMNNVSCKTENALVTFDVPTSSSKTRRAVSLPVDLPESADEEAAPSSALDSTTPTPVLGPRSVATSNGILYDNAAAASATSTGSTAKATTTSIPASSNSTTPSTSASTSTSVPTEVVEFSQVAVLYILEKTGSLTSAMWSEGQIQTYLSDSYVNATHPTLQLMGSYGLDFEKKTITLRNGTVVS
ncbi:uncharacterized protein N7473_009142 [Penicillium subrubescens]|uniref:EGF-like domain-containing protein n=1 Tax=Penicillium subrubescens TaxID=1316194 RepID=A0A1Q5UG79_9EURO|nr:uncharacterized protein N7473_009142 [Penicillium subrubescens]KAJ5886468.1 hypothetical protein N7473_009142 [Penicillium subrubescens]OKP11480.1 hypothetical protein PENSUB_2966 [Penicillium subrubescens]